MFGISVYEFLVILVVGIVIFKPHDMINVFVFIGKIISEIKLYFNKMEQEINQANVFSQLKDYIVIEKNKENHEDIIIKDDVSTPK